MQYAAELARTDQQAGSAEVIRNCFVVFKAMGRPEAEVHET